VKVFGLDPGTQKVGFGVVEIEGSRCRLVDHGVSVDAISLVGSEFLPDPTVDVEVQQIYVLPGDGFLACSDGLSDLGDEGAIATLRTTLLEEMAIVALVIFAVTFVAIVAAALLKPKSEIDAAARLPLENGEENGHRGEDGNSGGKEFPVGKDPGDEKDHLDVKEDEKHRGDVELHRKAGVEDAGNRNAAFVGGILDRIG